MSARRRAVRAGPSAAISPKRWRRAVGIVGMLLAAIALVGLVGQATQSGVLREATAQETWDTETPAGVLDIVLDVSERAGVVDVPPTFEDEVFSLEKRADIRADTQSGLVGFSCSGKAVDMFAALSDELVDNGWTSVESGSATCGTFVKGAGTYRWVFVSCVQVGDSTSTVVQSAAANEGSR